MAGRARGGKRRTETLVSRLDDARSSGLLNLDERKLSAIPDDIFALTHLTVLQVRQNVLTTIPEQIGQLASLTELSLQNNELTELPAAIGQLHSLRELWIFNNQLSSLPPEIGMLNSLMMLDVRNNKLASLPTEIGALQQLTELFLADNTLTTLPPSIGNLRQLKHLWLYNNRLASLPSSMGQLSALNLLDVRHNNLTTLAVEVCMLPELRVCKFENNNISIPPPEVLSEGLDAMRGYFGALTNLPQALLKHVDERMNEVYFEADPYQMDVVFDRSDDSAATPDAAGVTTFRPSAFKWSYDLPAFDVFDGLNLSESELARYIRSPATYAQVNRIFTTLTTRVTNWTPSPILQQDNLNEITAAKAAILQQLGGAQAASEDRTIVVEEETFAQMIIDRCATVLEGLLRANGFGPGLLRELRDSFQFKKSRIEELREDIAACERDRDVKHFSEYCDELEDVKADLENDNTESLSKLEAEHLVNDTFKEADILAHKTATKATTTEMKDRYNALERGVDDDARTMEASFVKLTTDVSVSTQKILGDKIAQFNAAEDVVKSRLDTVDQEILRLLNERRELLRERKHIVVSRNYVENLEVQWRAFEQAETAKYEDRTRKLDTVRRTSQTNATLSQSFNETIASAVDRTLNELGRRKTCYEDERRRVITERVELHTERIEEFCKRRVHALQTLKNHQDAAAHAEQNLTNAFQCKNVAAAFQEEEKLALLKAAIQEQADSIKNIENEILFLLEDIKPARQELGIPQIDPAALGIEIVVEPVVAAPVASEAPPSEQPTTTTATTEPVDAPPTPAEGQPVAEPSVTLGGTPVRVLSGVLGTPEPLVGSPRGSTVDLEPASMADDTVDDSRHDDIDRSMAPPVADEAPPVPVI